MGLGWLRCRCWEQKGVLGAASSAGGIAWSCWRGYRTRVTQRCGDDTGTYPFPIAALCFGVLPPCTPMEVGLDSGCVPAILFWQAGMCWQQLPALLVLLGIPHTLGTLAMLSA